jgi:uncharacterized Zn finger protein
VGEKITANIAETIVIKGDATVVADMTYTVVGGDAQKTTEGGTIAKVSEVDYVLKWTSGPDAETSTKITLAQDGKTFSYSVEGPPAEKFVFSKK